MRFSISKEVMDAILKTLAKQPYEQVFQLFTELNNDVKPIEENMEDNNAQEK